MLTDGELDVWEAWAKGVPPVGNFAPSNVLRLLLEVRELRARYEFIAATQENDELRGLLREAGDALAMWDEPKSLGQLNAYVHRVDAVLARIRAALPDNTEGRMKCVCGHDESEHRRNGACLGFRWFGNDRFICECNDYAALPDNPEGREMLTDEELDAMGGLIDNYAHPPTLKAREVHRASARLLAEVRELREQRYRWSGFMGEADAERTILRGLLREAGDALAGLPEPMRTRHRQLAARIRAALPDNTEGTG